MDKVFDTQPWGEPTAAERGWVAAVAEAAVKPAARPFDPTADALATRRLLSLVDGATPASVVLETWRAVEGARLTREGGLKLAVHGAGAAAAARARFGSAPACATLARADEALALARAPGVVAVIDAATSAWWGRLLAQPDLRVVGRLPDAGPAAAGAHLLAVMRATPEPTGFDETYWVTDAPGSPATVEAKLSDCGLAASLVVEAGGLKLMALAGYLQAHDERLARAPGRLCGVIGAAPLPYL